MIIRSYNSMSYNKVNVNAITITRPYQDVLDRFFIFFIRLINFEIKSSKLIFIVLSYQKQLISILKKAFSRVIINSVSITIIFKFK